MTQDEQAARTSGDETAYEPDPRRWRVLAVSLVVGFMSLLDVTIVNVAVTVHPGRARHLGRDHPVGGVGLRARLRHDPRRRRAARRRTRPAPDDDDRAHRLHRLQRRRGPGPQRGRHRARPIGPGRQRGPAHPPELRPHPAALPRRRARPRLRDVRLHRGRRIRRRTAHRRPADRPARRGERLALPLPHQRAHRPGGARADPPAGARQRVGAGAEAHRRTPVSTPSARCCWASPCWRCCSR